VAFSAFIRLAQKRCREPLLSGGLVRVFVFAALVLGGNTAAALDANSASAEQLEELRGIGPAISARIIEERTRGGAFLDMDDLRERVKGIGVANLKKFAAAGLSVSAPAGAVKGAGAPATRERNAPALRQSWVGRSGVVYYDPGPAPDAARQRQALGSPTPSGSRGR